MTFKHRILELLEHSHSFNDLQDTDAALDAYNLIRYRALIRQIEDAALAAPPEHCEHTDHTCPVWLAGYQAGRASSERELTYVEREARAYADWQRANAANRGGSRT